MAPIIGFNSRTGGSAPTESAAPKKSGNPSDPLNVLVPADNAQVEGTEEHVIEIAPQNANGLTISLALVVKPGHGGVNSATPEVNWDTRGTGWRIEGPTMDADGKPQYGGYKPRAAEMFLADLQMFLDRNPKWGQIALLKAGNNDHRIITRVEAGESYRLDTLESIAETMNKAERGELNPDDFRNLRRDKGGNEDGVESSSQGRPTNDRKVQSRVTRSKR